MRLINTIYNFIVYLNSKWKKTQVVVINFIKVMKCIFHIFTVSLQNLKSDVYFMITLHSINKVNNWAVCEQLSFVYISLTNTFIILSTLLPSLPEQLFDKVSIATSVMMLSLQADLIPSSIHNIHPPSYCYSLLFLQFVFLLLYF